MTYFKFYNQSTENQPIVDCWISKNLSARLLAFVLVREFTTVACSVILSIVVFIRCKISYRTVSHLWTMVPFKNLYFTIQTSSAVARLPNYICFIFAITFLATHFLSSVYCIFSCMVHCLSPISVYFTITYTIHIQYFRLHFVLCYFLIFCYDFRFMIRNIIYVLSDE